MLLYTKAIHVHLHSQKKMPLPKLRRTSDHSGVARHSKHVVYHHITFHCTRWEPSRYRFTSDATKNARQCVSLPKACRHHNAHKKYGTTWRMGTALEESLVAWKISKYLSKFSLTLRIEATLPQR